MKKLLSITLILIILLPGAVNAQDTEPSLAIPVVKGADVNTELTLTRDQILLQLDFVAPQIINESVFKNLEVDELKEAIGSLKEVQFAQMQTKTNTSVAETISFYEKEIGGKRVIYNIDPKLGIGLLVLSMPEDGGYFAAIVTPNKDYKGKPAAGVKINAARIVGSPDITKLAAIAGKVAASKDKPLVKEAVK